MTILFYKPAETDYAGRLEKMVVPAAGYHECAVTRCPEELKDLLIYGRRRLVAVILQVVSLEDAFLLLNMRELLEGMFLIVVNESRYAGMAAVCRQFYPRILAEKDDDLSIIVSVVEKRLAAVECPVHCRSH